MRAIVVAGGAGFVGSHLVRALLDRGNTVYVIDDRSSASSLNSRFKHRNLISYTLDVTALPAMRYERLDAVIHLASPASPVDYEARPIDTLLANSTGTLNLATLAIEHDAFFIYASSSEVYGDPDVHPQVETYRGNVDPNGPRSQYDEGKRFGEAMVTALRSQHGLRAAVLRIFNTYGPGMRREDGRVVPAFIDAALRGAPLLVHNDGSQTRSMMYVSDLVEAIRMTIDAEPDGLVANVGNPDEYSRVLVLARTIVQLTVSGSPIDLHVSGRPQDPRRRQPDISRIGEALGWRPTVDIITGLRSTIDWFKEIEQ